MDDALIERFFADPRTVWLELLDSPELLRQLHDEARQLEGKFTPEQVRAATALVWKMISVERETVQ